MHPSETDQTCFGKSPKAFDAVNMRMLISEFVIAMLNTIVFFITQINQAIIAAPAVGMDDAFKLNMTTYDPLKG